VFVVGPCTPLGNWFGAEPESDAHICIVTVFLQLISLFSLTVKFLLIAMEWSRLQLVVNCIRLHIISLSEIELFFVFSKLATMLTSRYSVLHCCVLLLVIRLSHIND
jgi:type IV secretory pathway TrbL component